MPQKPPPPRHNKDNIVFGASQQFFLKLQPLEVFLLTSFRFATHQDLTQHLLKLEQYGLSLAFVKHYIQFSSSLCCDTTAGVSNSSFRDLLTCSF